MPQFFKVAFRSTLQINNKVISQGKKRETNLMPAAVHDFVHSM